MTLVTPWTEIIATLYEIGECEFPDLVPMRFRSEIMRSRSGFMRSKNGCRLGTAACEYCWAYSKHLFETKLVLKKTTDELNSLKIEHEKLKATFQGLNSEFQLLCSNKENVPPVQKSNASGKNKRTALQPCRLEGTKRKLEVGMEFVSKIWATLVQIQKTSYRSRVVKTVTDLVCSLMVPMRMQCASETSRTGVFHCTARYTIAKSMPSKYRKCEAASEISGELRKVKK